VVGLVHDLFTRSRADANAAIIGWNGCDRPQAPAAPTVGTSGCPDSGSGNHTRSVGLRSGMLRRSTDRAKCRESRGRATLTSRSVLEDDGHNAVAPEPPWLIALLDAKRGTKRAQYR
jgi:hypothetical protein